MENPQAVGERAKLTAFWTIECRDAAGRLRWKEEYKNLITTEGLNLLLTRSFKTVPADVNWYVGLKGAGTVAAGDTMASHAGWAEVTGYAESTRPAFTPGTVASGAVSNSASKAAFTANASVTAAGAFLATNSTKGGTTGSLYGVGNFTTSRALESGDTLSVQVDLSAA
jgi:hypothetical protein